MRDITSGITVLSIAEMEARAPDVNPTNSVIATIEADDHTRVEYALCLKDGAIAARNRTIIEYISVLLEAADVFALRSVVFQGDDRPCDVVSASWQRTKGDAKVTLLPDFYYTENDGYRTFLPNAVVPWANREAKALWRGGTTGQFHQTVDDLAGLPRYRLCEIGRQLGSRADFGIYNVVQTKDEQQRAAIEARLRGEGLFRSHIPLEDFQRAKFIVQMDGNGNSWELVKKLRLGCCMLLVESPWELWHDQFIEPWMHFVPVKADLSDLPTILEWCMKHDDECLAIADRGRRFALDIDYQSEILHSGNMLLSSPFVNT